ncbi:MAG: hypothetical protein D6805_06150 [Planctomycetota bacterium]|nr:MAG: hypothetical protein D6805_06150 [Planctomycetota bacterium]
MKIKIGFIVCFFFYIQLLFAQNPSPKKQKPSSIPPFVQELISKMRITDQDMWSAFYQKRKVFQNSSLRPCLSIFISYTLIQQKFKDLIQLPLSVFYLTVYFLPKKQKNFQGIRLHIEPLKKDPTKIRFIVSGEILISFKDKPYMKVRGVREKYLMTMQGKYLVFTSESERELDKLHISFFSYRDKYFQLTNIKRMKTIYQASKVLLAWMLEKNPLDVSIQPIVKNSTSFYQISSAIEWSHSELYGLKRGILIILPLKIEKRKK